MGGREMVLRPFWVSLLSGILWIGGQITVTALGVERQTLREVEPDTPDFPDSPISLSPGLVLLEMAVVRERRQEATRLSVPTLIRIGVARGWELRVSSEGWFWERERGRRQKGIESVGVGFKRSFSDASGVIGEFQLPGRKGDPFSFTAFLTLGGSLKTLDGEVNIGVTWREGKLHPSEWKYHLLWAVGKEIKGRVGAFIHGSWEFSPKGGDGEGSFFFGLGFLYLLTPKVSVDMSFNWGRTGGENPSFFRVGSALLW